MESWDVDVESSCQMKAPLDYRLASQIGCLNMFEVSYPTPFSFSKLSQFYTRWV